MLSQFLKFLESENLCPNGNRVLLAVSGGMDSVVLTQLFNKTEIDFAIAHCNFKLRGKDSDNDEKFVRNLALEIGREFYSTSFDTSIWAQKHGISIQMAARELRYEWFGKISEKFGFDLIATGHHKDDQIETYFINLIRGTGIAGLRGMLPRQGMVIRPLLYAHRSEIEDFAEQNQYPFREDCSNSETKYLRNKIRHQMIPEFEALNPVFPQQLIKHMERMREMELVYQSAIDTGIGELLKSTDEGFKVSIDELKQKEPLTTWIYELLKPYGYSSADAPLIQKALKGHSGKQFFSPTHRIIIDRDDLLILPIEYVHHEENEFIIDELTREVKSPVHLSFEVIAGNQPISFSHSIACLDLNSVNFPLKLRKWKEGDSFQPLGMKGQKLISDFFIDNKLNLFEKEKTWLLCSGNDIVWIVGMRIDERYRITDQTQNMLVVRVV